jgi:hypothetical protein
MWPATIADRIKRPARPELMPAVRWRGEYDHQCKHGASEHHHSHPSPPTSPACLLSRRHLRRVDARRRARWDRYGKRP